MLYFTPFPTISYKIPNSTKSIPVTDITRRFSVANFLNNSSVAFDTYFVQDGERADSVAYDYYNDVTMDWLILLVNEIHDPYFQWPLSYEEMDSYLRDKYGSIEVTQKTIHHYEKIIQQGYIQNDNGTQRVVPEKTLVIDETTYISLSDFERKIKTIYEYEVELNEDRRKIYLLDLNYLLIIKNQHPNIFDGVTIR